MRFCQNIFKKMYSNQFIREFNQRFAAEKEKAHRKQVMQKKSKSCGSEKTWSIEKRISDNSAGKMSTHRYPQRLFESDHSFSIGSLLQKGTWFCYARLMAFKVLNLKQNLHCLIS